MQEVAKWDAVTGRYFCGNTVEKINAYFRDTITAGPLLLTMQFIELTNDCACASLDQQSTDYVIYTGGVAGISDATVLEGDAETVKRSPNKVELYRR